MTENQKNLLQKIYTVDLFEKKLRISEEYEYILTFKRVSEAESDLLETELENFKNENRELISS